MDTDIPNPEYEPRLPRIVTIPLGCAGRLTAFLLTFSFFVGGACSALAGMLLIVSGRDFTIGPDNLPFWPEWIAPRDLLHAYAWLYLLAAVMLPLFVLPLTLALLEKAIIAIEKKIPEKDKLEKNKETPPWSVA